MCVVFTFWQNVFFFGCYMLLICDTFKPQRRELSALLTVACLKVGQLVLLIFLHCEQNPFELHSPESMTGGIQGIYCCPLQMLPAAMKHVCNFRWTFPWWITNQLHGKSASQCNNRFRFMIPEQTFSFFTLALTLYLWEVIKISTLQ